MNVIKPLAALALLALAAPAFAGKYTPCPPGRYVVRGAQLIVGPGEPLGIDAVSWGASVSIDSGCAAIAPKKVKATKRGTQFRGLWTSCQNIFGKAKITGRIDPTCQTLTGIFTAKKARIRRPYTATLSTCGDEVFDPALEECDGTSGCTGGVCLENCTCQGGVTTTTTLNVTTTTGNGTSTTATPTTTSTTTTTAGSAKPDLVATAFTASSATVVSGQQMSVSFTVKNQGTAQATGTWYDSVYLSTDQFYSQNDTALITPAHQGPLAVNNEYTMGGQTITIPSTLAAGTYYLLFRTDAYGYVSESNENNNDAPAAVTLTVQTPDLVPTAFSASTSSIVSGQQMTVSWTVKNQGNGIAYGNWYDSVVLSADQFYSQNDTALATPVRNGPLAVNGTYTVGGQTITIPANLTAGTYYLLFRADSYGYLFENGQDANNDWPTAIELTVLTPDLVPTAFSASTSSIVSGQQMTVSWTVKNQGSGTAYGNWYDSVVLSTDQFFSQNDTALATPSRSGPLAANGTYTVGGQTITIPANLAAGTYYLLFRADSYGYLFEDGQDANNDWPTALELTVSAPDLVPTAFSASTSSIVSGQQMTVSWTVKNQGAGTAYGNWYDSVVLSSDQFFSQNDTALATPSRSGPLAPNGTYTVGGQTITIPANLAAGTYYLLFRTDSYGYLFEDGQDANNDWGTALTLTVQVPDLAPTAFSASTATITKGSQMTVSWTVKNQGSGTAYGNWYDSVVLSTDQFFSQNDVALATPSKSGPLAANATYSVNGQSITIPANTTPGSYYLIFRTDSYGYLFEDGLDGNNDATPVALTVN